MSVNSKYIHKCSVISKSWYCTTVYVHINSFADPFLIQIPIDKVININSITKDVFIIDFVDPDILTGTDIQRTYDFLSILLWKHKLINVFYNENNELNINCIDIKLIRFVTNIETVCKQCGNGIYYGSKDVKAKKEVLYLQKESENSEIWKHVSC